MSAGAMFTFYIVPDEGEPYTLVATARDFLLWEKSAKGKTFAQFLQNMSMVDMYRLAHVAARRQNMFHGNLADWENQVQVEPGLDEDSGESLAEMDPTNPAV